MEVGRARKSPATPLRRRIGYGCGVTALVLILGCENLQTAVANGDTRTISMHHLHTGEDITITYKKDGRYVPEAMKKLDHFLRDWRRNEEVKMDPHLIDLVWEVDREVGGTKPLQIVCGYRAPQTNAMLRRRSSGVAKFSQHTLGKALDFYIPDVKLSDLRVAGLRLQRGGVGFYPTSGSPFVHMDVGSVRHWPRMTREQLVKVFPNGRTVHVPSDGKPLKNYALALADIERRGTSEPSHTSLAAAERAGVVDEKGEPKGVKTAQANLFGKLFGFGRADEDEDTEVTSTRRGAAVAAAPAPQKAPDRAPSPATAAREVASAVPLPAARPAASARVHTFQVASAEPGRIVELPPRPAAAASLVAKASAEPAAADDASANDVIKSRGFWQGPARIPAPAATAERTAIPAKAKAPAPRPEPVTTASVTPWPLVEQNDRVPTELALAYAAQPVAAPPPAPAATAPMGAKVEKAPLAAIPPATTVALKGSGAEPTRALTAASLTAHAKAHYHRTPEERRNDPWLRAMVLAPDVRNFMSTSLYGSADFRSLEPLLHAPQVSIMMTFSAGPGLRPRDDRFGGAAISFVPTVTFDSRHTAQLQ